MKTKFFTLSMLILLVGALLLAGCASAAGDVLIGSESAGSTVELKTGQVLVISLPSNPTTGYSWHVAQIDESILKQVGEVEFVQAAGDEQLVGAGGVEKLSFETVASGTTTLTLTYDRVWEDIPPEQTFTVTILVP
jgi:inhibitor of cysteine peptidase